MADRDLKKQEKCPDPVKIAPEMMAAGLAQLWECWEMQIVCDPEALASEVFVAMRKAETPSPRAE